MGQYPALNRRNISILMLITAAFFWRSTFLFTKFLVDNMSVYCILLGRSGIATVLLYFIYRKAIHREIFKAFASQILWLFSIAGFLALALQTEGLKYTTATNSAFITALFIVFIPFIKLFIYRESLTFLFWISVITALVGLYIISFGFNFPDSINPGDFLSLCCAIFYAFYILLLEKLSVKFSEGTIMFFYFALQSLISLSITLY
jgi:drug/metabolite transporter (DMT)-like permease